MDLIKGTSQQNQLYVHNAWYVAAFSQDLVVGQLQGLVIINKPVLIYRKADATVTAMADQCCHRSAPLSKGRLEGDAVRCMYHGLLFSDQGKCLEIPGQDEVPERFQVRTYAVQEAHGLIWVWMGDDAASANPALIPAATGPDDPAWQMNHGFIDYQANYLLVNDNLTDFSHISFVHEQTFARGSKATAVQSPRVQIIERGIRITRWNKGMPPSAHRPGVGELDQFMTYDYLVPGVLIMYTATYPGGTADSVELGHPGDLEPTSATFTTQAVTPMTDGTTRYFFCWGPRASEHAQNPQLLDLMWQMASAAFEEDRVMIEAQQRNILLQTGAPLNAITHDRGPTMMRKVIDRLIAEENADEWEG